MHRLLAALPLPPLALDPTIATNYNWEIITSVVMDGLDIYMSGIFTAYDLEEN